MAVSSDEFRSALSRFASGVTVVTTRDSRGRKHGITVSSFCSVSLEPPLILVCIENTAGSHYAFLESRTFAVNILTIDQAPLSEKFATLLENKFENVETTPGTLGVPLISGALGSIECKLTKTFDGGDHSIFVGEVEAVHLSDGFPLVYFRGNYRTIKPD